MCVENRKALMNCTLIAQLFCDFIFVYIKTGFLMTRLICFWNTLMLAADVVLL